VCRDDLEGGGRARHTSSAPRGMSTRMAVGVGQPDFGFEAVAISCACAAFLLGAGRWYDRKDTVMENPAEAAVPPGAVKDVICEEATPPLPTRCCPLLHCSNTLSSR
jgi:hypothetical protein